MAPAVCLGVLVAFLFGSLPFAYLLPRLLFGVDVRRVGSGNPGATNVIRAVGRPTGLVVGALDFLKGYAGVVAIEMIAPGSGASGQVAAAVAAVMGHNWSPFLGFRGGKGILTSAGGFARIAWLPVVGAGAVFAVVFRITGFVSAGSLAGAVALPVLVALIPGSWNTMPVLVAATVITLMALVRHRTNIRSLLAGSELRPKSGRRRPASVKQKRRS